MSDQTAPASEKPKLDPESLMLRSAPRRVVRFRRGVLIGTVAIVSCALLAVTFLALRGPAMRGGERVQELYSTERKPMADGLSALPGSYEQLQPETPQLGPPLPGDLGGPILERQRQLGLQPVAPDVEGQAAEAERQRLAQQARQAREASVFFQISGGGAGTARGASVQPAPLEAAVPVAGQAGTGRLNLDPERDQNNQQRKLDFLDQPPDPSVYSRHALQTPVSPYQVMAGSVIAASLITGINSDLPGLVAAQVTENVYDTVTGRVLLIPQGARLIGSYDSVVAFGQSRALLVWQRIVMPDGSSIQLDNLPATDAAGYAGLEDEVDYHTWRLIAGVALSTLLGVGTELTLGDEESDLVRALRESTQRNASRAGQRLVERNLNIQPTITVRPGWPLRVIVHKDLVLRPYRS